MMALEIIVKLLSCIFSETFLMFIYMKNGRTRIGGMELKSKWSLKEIGQLTV